MVIDSKIFTVAFRCDASKTIGVGHVMRCLSLAEALRLRGAEVFFICSDETVKSVKSLADSTYKIVAENYASHVDWLVIDHYALDADNYERAAREWAKKILVIDDLANRLHDCDVLVDMTYGRDSIEYDGLVPADCKIFTGAQYALLRPEFYTLRQKLRRNFSDARRVLVSFGGVNPKGATEKALRMLSHYRDRHLEIDVVIGSNTNGLGAIHDLVEQINFDRHHSITLHIDAPDIANLMTKAHLCLGAGGTTSWERCCLALPALVMELAENQSRIAQNLHESGSIINIGRIEGVDDFLEKVFCSLISNEVKLSLMSDSAASVCDGMGVLRILKVIECI